MIKQLIGLKVAGGVLLAIATTLAVVAIQGTTLERRAVFPRPDGAAEISLFEVKHAWPGAAKTYRVRLTTRTGAVLRHAETTSLAAALPVLWASDSVSVGQLGRWPLTAGLAPPL